MIFRVFLGVFLSAVILGDFCAFWVGFWVLSYGIGDFGVIFAFYAVSIEYFGVRGFLWYFVV